MAKSGEQAQHLCMIWEKGWENRRQDFWLLEAGIPSEVMERRTVPKASPSYLQVSKVSYRLVAVTRLVSSGVKFS